MNHKEEDWEDLSRGFWTDTMKLKQPTSSLDS